MFSADLEVFTAMLGHDDGMLAVLSAMDDPDLFAVADSALQLCCGAHVAEVVLGSDMPVFSQLAPQRE